MFLKVCMKFPEFLDFFSFKISIYFNISLFISSITFWIFFHGALPFSGPSLSSLTNPFNSFSGESGMSSWFESIAGELV